MFKNSTSQLRHVVALVLYRERAAASVTGASTLQGVLTPDTFKTRAIVAAVGADLTDRFQKQSLQKNAGQALDETEDARGSFSGFCSSGGR